MIIITTMKKRPEPASEQNYRVTKQRKVILEELRKVRSHPTADQVYEMVRQRLPHISLGTVYRNLEILSERGIIQRLDLGGTQMRFDGDTSMHYHVRCVSCGRVDDVPVEPATELNDAVRGASDYEIIGHRLELVGLCPKCQKRRHRPGKVEECGCSRGD